MKNLNDYLTKQLIKKDVSLVGFADLSTIMVEERHGLPYGIVIAINFSKSSIESVRNSISKEYIDEYSKLSGKLDELATFTAMLIEKKGYKAIAQTSSFVRRTMKPNYSVLPHKTIATKAGIGWIGKNVLLVTKEYGSAVRLVSILTDAPILTSKSINESLCGKCMLCVNACPAHALKGNNWNINKNRDDLIDINLCLKGSKEVALETIQINTTYCGKCIAVCPYTLNYLNN